MSDDLRARYPLLDIPPRRSVLYEAYDIDLDRVDSVLGIPIASRHDRDRLRRDHILPWAGLCHAGIPAVYHLIETDTAMYLVGEPRRGVCLQAHFESGDELGPKDFRRLLEALVEVLDYAHSQQTFHGALYPEQIFLLENGQIVLHRVVPDLIDTIICPESTAASSGLARFQAPEQREPIASGPASDIFALGVLLHRLVWGYIPVSASAVPDGKSGFPRSLGSAIRQCMAGNPEQRFSSVTSLLECLYPDSPLGRRHEALARDCHREAVRLMRDRRFEEAILQWKTADSLQPGDAGLNSNIGVAYLRLGFIERALESFREALEFSPEGSYFALHVAWTLWRLGRPEEAAAFYHGVGDFQEDVQPGLLDQPDSGFFQRVSPAWPTGSDGGF